MKDLKRAERHDGVNVGYQANYRTSARGKLPPAMRRSIAMAIELERTHDHLAAYIGHGMPIPNRIIAPESTSSRRSKLNLPRNLSGELLSQMHLDRLTAIESLYAELSETMSGDGQDHLHQIVSEAREIAESEQYIYVTRRRATSASLDPDDRRSVAESHLANIIRAAENPPPAAPVIEKTITQTPGARSIAIDLFIDGLLTYHKVDRAKLFKAIDTLRKKDRKNKLRESLVMFATPATRSNEHPMMAAFGFDFPKAVFKLRGDTLETQSLEMIASDAANDNDVWSYRAGAPTQIILSRRSMLRGVPMHDLERRALSDVIPDPRFHRALVIDRADRIGGESGALAKLKLRPAFAYLQPPGSPAHQYQIRRPSDVRQGNGYQGAFVDLKYADLVIEELPRKGIHQRFRIEPIEAGGLRLRLADPGHTALAHHFEIKRETLQAGSDAIAARLDIILDLMAKQKSRKDSQPAPRPSNVSAGAGVEALQDISQSDEPTETTLDRFLRVHSSATTDQWEICDRVDALLFDRLKLTNVEPDPDIEFHAREGLIAIRTARLTPDVYYRLERFDRVLGKISHAIGVLEIERPMSVAMIEGLRDGKASQIINQFPEFGRAQVRKIARSGQGALVTIRVPIHEKPSG